MKKTTRNKTRKTRSNNAEKEWHSEKRGIDSTQMPSWKWKENAIWNLKGTTVFLQQNVHQNPT
jgi:hypothetical protein